MTTTQRRSTWRILPLLWLGLHTGCGPSADSSRVVESETKEPTMKLTSSAFGDGGAIPERYTGVGKDISPPLAWSSVPDGTKSFALICDDPDAPSRAKPRPEGPWVHWVVYNIPAQATELPEAVSRQAEPAQVPGARQGQNDFDSDNIGYRGPLPPKAAFNPHRAL